MRDLQTRGLDTHHYRLLLMVPWVAGPHWMRCITKTRQRSSLHKAAGILNELSKFEKGKAKAALQEIWIVESRKAPEKTPEAFVSNL
jgi:predicted TPR repeat methyltransferase